MARAKLTVDARGMLVRAFLVYLESEAPEMRDDHASYIASWLEVLKNDKRTIFQAASHAQRAVDFLHRLQAPREEVQAA